MKKGYKASPEYHPCSMCGLPTRSKLPMCWREGECRRESFRLSRDVRPPRPGQRRSRRRITQTCSVCGQPTSSRAGVCSRLGKCRVENQLLRRPARPGKDASLSHPCSLCGQPTRSKLPVCSRAGECRKESNRLQNAVTIRNPDRHRPTQPCSICGRPTSSELGVCTRPGCRSAGRRLAWAAKPKAGKIDAPSHSCSICGRPTTSRFPVCCRGGECKVEYMRLFVEDYDPPDRGERRERRPTQPCLICGEPTTAKYPMCTRPHSENQTAGSVYAVWFPYPRILKVGFTASWVLFVSGVRGRAKRRGWEVSDSRCIWNYPGDVRTEAFMQATLAFRWPSAVETTSSRLCEWFRAPGLSEVEMVKILDEIYGMVPADETADVPASLF